MAAILNSYFVQCGPFVYQTIWIVDSNLSGFWKLQVFNVPYSSAHCVLCILTSKCMLAHAFTRSKTMKNMEKWWKKYLFQLFLCFSSWALHEPLVHIKEKVLFHHFWKFLIIFDHANVCASMHLLAKYTTTVCYGFSWSLSSF